MELEHYYITYPARIIEYDPVEQLATVKICAERVYNSTDSDDNLIEEGELFNVPVFTPGGGNWHLTFPIKAGDPCLLHFSQVGYDHWLYKNEDEAGIRADGHPQPWLRRSFDAADAFCQVGWNNIPTAIEAYSPTDSEWRNIDAAQVITLKEDLDIVITTPTDVTINCANATVNADDKVEVNCTDSVLNASNSVSIVTTTKTVDASGSTTYTTPTFTIEGDLVVTGTSNLQGAATLDETLKVTKATTLEATLGVAGAATMAAVAASSVAASGTVGGTSIMAGTLNLGSHIHKLDISENETLAPQAP